MIDQPPLALCGWPGLASLWLRGRWTSLLVAIGFSFLFNLALVSTFVWPAMLSDSVKALLWPGLAVLWTVGAWNSWRMLKALQKNGQESFAKPTDSHVDTLFIQAQTEYLREDYQQSEALLAQRLQEDHRDVESRLLLASVFERSGRLERAARQLDMLKRLDESRPWRFEIERLRLRIENETGSIADHDDEAANNDEEEFADHHDKLETTNQEGQSQVQSIPFDKQESLGKIKLGQAIQADESTDRSRLKMEDHDDPTQDPTDLTQDPSDNNQSDRRAA